MTVFTWEIGAESAREIVLFKRTILKRVAAHLAREPSTIEAAGKALDLVSTVDQESFIHPHLVELAMGWDHADSKVVDGLLAAASQRSDLQFHPGDAEPWRSDVVIDWARTSLIRQSRQLESDLHQDPELVLGNPLGRESESVVREAQSALASVWPEAAALTRDLVTHFVWFSAPSYWSSTDPVTFGAVYVNPRSHWSMPHFFETLLHEGGHLHLMVKQTIDPLLLNPEERTESPLRADRRPLKGVLHATFVLVRMTEGLWRLAAEGGPHAASAKDMARVNLRRLGKGLASLASAARFTPSGKVMMDSILEGHARLCKEVAGP